MGSRHEHSLDLSRAGEATRGMGSQQRLLPLERGLESPTDTEAFD